jgi:hypothetical protein
MSDRSPDQTLRALFDVVLSREYGDDMTCARALALHLNELGLEEMARELRTALAKQGVFEIVRHPQTGDIQSITGDLYHIRQTAYRLKVACLERGEPADHLAAIMFLENLKKRLLSPQAVPTPQAPKPDGPHDEGTRRHEDARPEPARTDPPASPASAIQFSEDFRALRWGNETFTFTEKQAAVCRALWDSRGKGLPGVSGQMLLEAAGSSMVEGEKPRLRELFRDHKAPRRLHKAWGRIILRVENSLYRLADPPE